jgi:hypothetical protein
MIAVRKPSARKRIAEFLLDKVCEVCRQPISDEERWFRVRKEYVHISCYEKYLRMVSERRQQAKTAPPKPAPDTGD